MFYKISLIFLSFILAFILVFFISIFWNPYFNTVQADATHWFWINRGLIIPWSGFAAPNTVVELPFIRAPFVSSKIIDLRVFTPIFSGVMTVFYLLLSVVTKRIPKKLLLVIVIPLYVILIPIAIRIYLNWFPRT